MPKAKRKRAQVPWKSRIIRHEDIDPNTLTVHPDNWRIHPKAQQEAMEGILADVGWVQQIIVNQRSGHILDGHMRVELAIKHKVTSVPVTVVDLTKAEETEVLALLDPIGALAKTNKDKISALLNRVATKDESLTKLLANLSPMEDAGASDDGGMDEVETVYEIIVQCRDEQQQLKLLGKFTKSGLRCRALTI